MEEESEKLSLTNIKGGGAVEMFDRAMQQVLENINDINTTTKARSVTLKVVFAPTEDRTMVGMEITCTPTFCSQDKEKLTADLRLDSAGRAFAVERINRQRPLPMGNVKPMMGLN